MRQSPLAYFSRSEVFFSLKTFTAAMLAMYLANLAGLSHPFWAMTTAYVVSNPLAAGAVRSKAVDRFIGTFIGGLGAVLIVPVFSNSRTMTVLAMSIWVATCLFISLSDRTSRSYAFMLGGYTAAVIGFPSVQAPLEIVNTAIVRIEEISLAILCATTVHSIVFPTSLAPAVLTLVNQTLRSARLWFIDTVTFSLPSNGTKTQSKSASVTDHRNFAANIVKLRLLLTHLPYDVTHLRWATAVLGNTQDRIASLTASLSSIEDRLMALQAIDAKLDSELVCVLNQTKQILTVLGNQEIGAANKDAAKNEVLQSIVNDEIPELAATISALYVTPNYQKSNSWRQALYIDISERLTELLVGFQDCTAQQLNIQRGLSGLEVPAQNKPIGNRVLHRDYGIAALSALTVVVATCLSSFFWIMTGWPAGSAAAWTAAVVCCMCANLDDPAPALNHLVLRWWILFPVPVCALYLLILLPMVNSFAMLILICAPFFILLGCFLARPSTNLQAVCVYFGVGGTIAMHDTASADINTFLNFIAAELVGAIIGINVITAMRSMRTEWILRRIQRATLNEIGALAKATQSTSTANMAFTIRMLDRIDLIATRAVQVDASNEGEHINEALTCLRLGNDILTLQRLRDYFSSREIVTLLDNVATHFRKRDVKRFKQPPSSLLSAIDALLNKKMDYREDSNNWRMAVSALVGLRRNLFPDASPSLSTARENLL